jgi:hypothetical protein
MATKAKPKPPARDGDVSLRQTVQAMRDEARQWLDLSPLNEPGHALSVSGREMVQRLYEAMDRALKGKQ